MVSAVFSEMQAAIRNKNWRVVFSYLTPEQQRRQLSVYVFRIEQQSSQASPKINRDFHDFLSKQGIAPGIPTDKESDEMLQRRFAKVSSVSTMLAALVGWVEKHADRFPNKAPLGLKNYNALAGAEVLKVTIRGDLAIVRIRFESGQEANINVRRSGNDWALDFYRK